METTELGASGLQVSRLAFGGCPMGGHGWGNVSREDFVRAINVALDSGLNFFDTADTYGLGEGERTLGEALQGRRDDAVIATKFGVRVEGGRTFYDNSPTWIRTALENSLERLGTDHVDLYQIHYRDGATPLADVVGTLRDLQQEGKIRHLGLSNVGRDDAADLGTLSDAFVSFQDEFSLANRAHEDDMLALADHFGFSPLTWGSLGQGILTGKYDATSTFGPDDRRSRSVYVNFHGDKLAHNLRIVEVLRSISGEVGKSVAAVAVRWILDHVPGTVAIVGIKNVKQLESNLEAVDWHLPAEAISVLDSISTTKERVS
ncbi:Predicted oxidoreductase [Raineyella antarctica]|uniref:Predicted oxidoreductase n=1 Tax=Raineyella antarctica TaxID=1577474 RepID=A0A1G6GEJ3_9ACTN|nr:aldo/keto reductase [Raineyella antarctica]SDB80384.1 Predicted oxidoreductase [Raineyella antarctica]